MDLDSQGGAAAAAAKVEEKKEKTAFDVKLEKFDAGAKIKVIKEVRAFTTVGLKEAKEMVEKVEKVPVVLKQGVTKEEANNIIEKIKAAGQRVNLRSRSPDFRIDPDLFDIARVGRHKPLIGSAVLISRTFGFR